MWRIQAMAANRRRRNSGADIITEAIHRMVDADTGSDTAQGGNCTS